MNVKTLHLNYNPVILYTHIGVSVARPVAFALSSPNAQGGLLIAKSFEKITKKFHKFTVFCWGLRGQRPLTRFSRRENDLRSGRRRL